MGSTAGSRRDALPCASRRLRCFTQRFSRDGLAWLTFDTHVEPAARALGLSEVTVRSHLRAVEDHMQRDLATLAGVRDLQFSLHVVTGQPDLSSDRPGLSVVAC